ncbi:hypothetical protein GCM10023321_75660 [Pseudonocardia eucalypti]|uniref:Uncharacterized protein n=1 Tax=Pseudonocardia eucalypti TaxID=648755 RepID=A0ABP9R9P9_9PSEU|nr:hypothetical protein [Pseudonocardia eucalypti]
MRSAQPRKPATQAPDALRAAVRDALTRDRQTDEVPAVPLPRPPAQSGRGGNGAPVARHNGQPAHGRGGRSHQPNIARPLRRRGG